MFNILESQYKEQSAYELPKYIDPKNTRSGTTRKVVNLKQKSRAVSRNLQKRYDTVMHDADICAEFLDAQLHFSEHSLTTLKQEGASPHVIKRSTMDHKQ